MLDKMMTAETSQQQSASMQLNKKMLYVSQLANNKANNQELVVNGNGDMHDFGYQSDDKASCLMTASNANVVSIGDNSLVEKFELNSLSNELTENDRRKLVERSIHWCLVNGFVFVPRERDEFNDLMTVTYLPFTLFPSPFSRAHYKQVYDLQPSLNELIFKISNSKDIIEANFSNLQHKDHFITSLLNAYNYAQKHGYNQKITFSILRCDYMLHQSENSNQKYSMKQVEMNTIAAGFSYVSTKATELHKQILKWTNNHGMISKLPENKAVTNIAKGFVEAWRLYNDPSAIVLFIVVDYEINIADQRHLEYEINKLEPKIEIQRCTLKEIFDSSHLDQSDKSLIYNNKPVAIVYYRAGYAPEHFKSQNEWDAILKIELSKAIKCPNIGTFLAGMKKFQEHLASKENLLKICDGNEVLAESFSKVFAQFFKLDSEKNLEKVLKNPQNYVLKPQREGGGNNLYDSQIKEVVSKMLEKSLNKSHQNGCQDINENDIYSKELYIVMELLKPQISHNYIISSQSQLEATRQKEYFRLEKAKISNELGIYGVLLKNGQETVLNEACGYLLRSKRAEDNEGGVMHGTGALDSIYFVD